MVAVTDGDVQNGFRGYGKRQKYEAQERRFFHWLTLFVAAPAAIKHYHLALSIVLLGNDPIATMVMGSGRDVAFDS